MKNISKIISIFYLSFSLLLLLYVFYRSQIFHEGTKLDYYLKYYVIAFLSVILSFIFFFIPSKLKISITYVFVSILIGLYLVEGYLIIQNKLNINLFVQNQANQIQDNSVIYKNITGKVYDKRTRYEAYQDLKIKNPELVSTVFPMRFINDKNLNYFPLSGISNRKTIGSNENGYYSIFQTDRYGFRNPNDEWDKDEIEFFLIGSSFTYGSYVNEEDTISGNLRKLNNNKNGILNLAMPDNRLLIKYATLREYLPIKKVKRVLLMSSEVDYTGLNDELKNKILVNYLIDKKFTQHLISKKQEIQKLLLKKFKSAQDVLEAEDKQNTLAPLDFFNQRSERNKITNFLILSSVRKNTIERFFLSPPPTKEFKNILKLSNELTKQNNSKLYFVYFPHYSKYIDVNNHDNSDDHKIIINIVESLNIPIIDLDRELFKLQEDPLSLFPFRKPYHYNEKGFQLVAETIFRKINEFEK